MSISFRRIAFAAAILIFAAGVRLASQSTFQASPQRVLQLENEEVAVWKSVIPAHNALAMHTHEHPRIITALVGGTIKIAYEDGTAETQTWETGKSYWLPASEGLKRHADQNVGSKPIEVMVVELKKVH